MSPVSLEEAFELVKQRTVTQATITESSASVAFHQKENSSKEKSDPFNGFLTNLAKIIKDKKENEETNSLRTFTENTTHLVAENQDTILSRYNQTNIKSKYIPTKKATDELEEVLTETFHDENIKSNDPLTGFLLNLVETLKHEKTKDSTISLTEQMLPNKEVSQNQATSNNVTNTQLDTTNNSPQKGQTNSYVKALTNISSAYAGLKKGSKKRTDIKKLIAEHVAVEFNRFMQQHPNLGSSGGGGGGTNAVQYALGGTIGGDLNVTGRILSGGVDLTSLLGGGSGPTNQLVAGSQTFTLNTDGTMTFPNNILESSSGIVTTEGLNSIGPILSGSQNLTDIFLTNFSPMEIDGGIYFS